VLRAWWRKWLLENLSANEAKGACVYPSRPRPASRSTGRIHISDFRYAKRPFAGPKAVLAGAIQLAGARQTGHSVSRVG
jgi:hypothetical protein